jgi:transcriptional regulator GlxA family with amidase domain
MSVCTGAFVLASTALLSGKAGNVASSGGLSCGIDLALRVVERYYGHDVARQTASTWNIRAKVG